MTRGGANERRDREKSKSEKRGNGQDKGRGRGGTHERNAAKREHIVKSCLQSLTRGGANERKRRSIVNKILLGVKTEGQNKENQGTKWNAKQASKPAIRRKNAVWRHV